MFMKERIFNDYANNELYEACLNVVRLLKNMKDSNPVVIIQRNCISICSMRSNYPLEDNLDE